MPTTAEIVLGFLDIWDVSSYYDGEYDWHDGIKLTPEEDSETQVPEERSQQLLH